jgi:hypothetical protein
MNGNCEKGGEVVQFWQTIEYGGIPEEMKKLFSRHRKHPGKGR